MTCHGLRAIDSSALIKSFHFNAYTVLTDTSLLLGMILVVYACELA